MAKDSSQAALKTFFVYLFLSRATWHGRSWFPDQGSTPGPSAAEVQSLNHWATREIPKDILLRAFLVAGS